ncbi:MAG: hypothetical protein JXM79_23970 [Sedimentisphaerales bacterium]|nr:hypothetical protein [Sedimentisphaerales bacterium]
MTLDRGLGRNRLLVWKRGLIILLAASIVQAAENTPNTQIWDTTSPLPQTVDFGNRNRWKRVPTDLFDLEEDPLRSTGDPGYSGREYAFQGDAIIENPHYTAVFQSQTGRVLIYPKADSTHKLIDFTPLPLKGKPGKIMHYRLLQNTGDEAALEVTFSDDGAQSMSAVIAFGPSEIIEIKPAENMKGISLSSPIEYGIVPSFLSDDLIFSPKEYASMESLCIPSENLLIGLLQGRDDMLVVTWPKGNQRTTLALGSEPSVSGGRLIESIDLDNDGKNVYLAILNAPGIWHKEEFTLSFLEKDNKIDWKRPFPARWVTQLPEGSVKTTYTFRGSRLQRIWRGAFGSYVYPVWFSEADTYFHMSKKIPPKEESIIYCLERQNTPLSMSTPADILKNTLGRPASDAIIDLPGRVMRTHHRRGAEGVRRACTCGCTEAIQIVFEAHEEVKRKEYVIGAVDDMVFFVTQHVGRIQEYQDFARDILKLSDQASRSNPELKTYLDAVSAIAEEIIQDYDRSKENMKTLAYMDDLVRQTKALTRKDSPKNLPAYLELGKKWRAMGGAQDDVVAQCHRNARKLFQEAGYRCVDQPKAVEIAEQIRARCRECLRNADGYEIWPNY